MNFMLFTQIQKMLTIVLVGTCLLWTPTSKASSMANPVLICPANVTIECGSSLDPDVNPALGKAIVEGPCELAVVDFTDQIISSNCGSTAQILRTWFLIGGDCNIEQNCTQIIDVIDTTAPRVIGVGDLPPTVFDCSEDLNFQVQATVTAIANAIQFSDNCTGTFIRHDYFFGKAFAPSDVCPRVGTLIVNFTLEDPCGNTTPALVSILELVDNTPPQFTNVVFPRANCSDPANIDQSILEQLSEFAAIDNCGGEVTISHDFQAGRFFKTLSGCGLVQNITVTATDECGNSTNRSINVNIFDEDAPLMDCPNDITIECRVGNTEEALDYLTQFRIIDDCSDTFSEIQVQPAINPEVRSLEVGVYEVTLTASDACSNASSCSRRITVSDNTPPQLLVPDPLTFDCQETDMESRILAFINEAVTMDNCSENIELSHTFEGIDGKAICDLFGTTEVLITATDEAGNSTTKSTSFTIEAVGPQLVCFPDVTLNCIEDFGLPLTVVTPGCADILEGGIVIDGPNLLSGSPNCPGAVYELVRTVTDECGLTASCTEKIFIDNPAPTIVCPEDKTVSCIEDINISSSDVQFEVSCGTDAVVEISEPIISGPANCNGTVVTYIFTVTDACGRVAKCKTNFFIENEEPSISCLPDSVVECSEDIVVGPEDVLYTTSCGLAADVIISGPVFRATKDCPGSTVSYTYTVVDECGRSASCVRVFRIQNAAPTIGCAPDAIVSCKEDIVVSPEDVSISSSCGLGTQVAISEPIANGPEFCPGTVFTVTYTATDACGRSVSCDRQFTIQNEAPIITEAADITVHCIEDIHVSPADISVESACGQAFEVNIIEPELHEEFNCSQITLVYLYQVIDECGRTSEDERFITVEHKAPFLDQPEDIIVDCLDTTKLFDNFPYAYSYCGGLKKTMEIKGPEYIQAKGADCVVAVYTVIYSIFDDCGVMICVSHSVTVDDEPVFMAKLPQDTIVACGQVPEVPQLEARFACEEDSDVHFEEKVVEGENKYFIFRYWQAQSDCGQNYIHVQKITVDCAYDGYQAKERRGPAIVNEAVTNERMDEAAIMILAPNPVQERLNIRYQHPLAAQQASLHIFDASGRELLQEHIFLEQGQNDFQLTVQAIPAGMYTLVLRSSKEVLQSRRFVKFIH